MISEWTEGVCGDGAAILRDGQMVPITELLAHLNAMEAEVAREREACAKIAADHEKRALRAGAIVTAGWCLDIAAAIRARGEGKP